MNELQRKWRELSGRERRMVVLTAVVLFAVLFYLLVWTPVSTGIDETRRKVAAQEKQLRELQAMAAEVRRLRGSGKAAGASRLKGSLLGTIQASAERKGLGGTLKKVQPSGQDGRSVILWMENAPFDVMVDWLGLLNRQYGVQVTEITVERRDEPGRVNSRMVLNAP